MPDYLKTTTPCLYTDNTQIFASRYYFNKLIENVNSDLNNIQNWLAKISFNIIPLNQKLFIKSSYNLVNKISDIPVLLNDLAVPRTNTYKCLDVEVDEKLSCEKHNGTICKKASVGIGAIKRVKPFVPVHTLQSIYKALIQPCVDHYSSPLWDNCGKLLQDKLQKFQPLDVRRSCIKSV